MELSKRGLPTEGMPKREVSGVSDGNVHFIGASWPSAYSQVSVVYVDGRPAHLEFQPDPQQPGAWWITTTEAAQ